ncbi:MAG TPA: hypothetical protein VG675_08965 [Bryobacteraceae bacterium]|nr:hypothetical protein [Bryobacteraceae bacterium]
MVAVVFLALLLMAALFWMREQQPRLDRHELDRVRRFADKIQREQGPPFD